MKRKLGVIAALAILSSAVADPPDMKSESTGAPPDDQARVVPADTTTPQVTREDADDLYFAGNLLAENGLGDKAELIDRVVRGRHETVVWLNNEYAGLPVFFSSVGYRFGANRRLERDPKTGEPLRLGDSMPTAGAFPIDHRADIKSQVAIDAWIAAARDVDFPGRNYEPPSEAEATLGFYDVSHGANPPNYRLVWRVKPRGRKYPLAMVSAKKGDVLFFDSGVRTAAPHPNHSEPESVDLAGTWISAPCGGRRNTRKLVLDPDGSFKILDYNSVTYSGHWSKSRPSWVSLDSESPGRNRQAPLPLALDYMPASGRLNEATPGNAKICFYVRESDQ